MNVEYVKLSHNEKVFGEISMLNSQLNILEVFKKYSAYKKLRNEEFLLKISARKSLEELKNTIEYLEKAMPKSRFEEEKKHEDKIKKEIAIHAEKAEIVKKPEKRKTSIDEELERIKQKLARLR